MSKAPTRSGRTLRCAVYTRKSSEEGLEQEFNSLHAQREACEAFIRSQRHEGGAITGNAIPTEGRAAALGSVRRPSPARAATGEMRRFRPFAGPRWNRWSRPQMRPSRPHLRIVGSAAKRSFAPNSWD